MHCFRGQKMKHRFCDEILFIGDIKPFIGDSNLHLHFVFFYKSGILVLVLFSCSFCLKSRPVRVCFEDQLKGDPVLFLFYFFQWSF